MQGSSHAARPVSRGGRPFGRPGSSNNARPGARPGFRSSGPSRSGGGGGSRFGGPRRFNGASQRRAVYIDPRRFINKPTGEVQVEAFVPQHTFTDFGFLPELVKNIAAKKYESPSRIQDESMPHILAGKDIIGLADTGSGKTAAFVLPLIQLLKTSAQGGTALIMAPTRELATQISDEFRAFARGLGLYSALCVGGASMGRQQSELSRRPQVVIGTPGRLKDLFEQGYLKLGNTKILVLDEADHMLDMGFVKDVTFLIEKTPAERQSLCFSATITKDVQKLLDMLLKNPVTIAVRKSETGEHIEQDVIPVSSADEKLSILSDLLIKPEFEKVLIFGETKRGVQRLADYLTEGGIRAEALHGNKSQPQRQRALNAFKENRVKVLVATDVAARGIDVPYVTHVINYDIPNNHDDYIHRIGRTARAGRKGKALTFVRR